MSTELGIAVVGAGLLGQRHARVWDELDGTSLQWVVDLDETRARTAADPRGARSSTDLVAALDDPLVDAVSVASPDHLHRDLVVAALDAGRHVFVEKPLATSTADAAAIVGAAQRNDRVVHVNFSQRWLADYSYIKRVIDAGEIGVPQFVVSTKRDTIFVPTGMIPWAASTSPAFFMTSHDLDLIRWFTGQEPQTVVAHETRGVLDSHGVPVHDAVQALVRFDGGVSANFSTAWIHPTTYPMVAEDRLEIVGSEGVVEYHSRGRRLDLHNAVTARTIEFSGPATATEHDNRLVGAFVDSCAHFRDSLIAGTQPDTAAADSTLAVACQEAMIASARDGGRVIELSNDV